MPAIRPATPADLEPLTLLWEAGWHEAHDALVPAELIRLRTRASFRDRLAAMGDRLRTAGPPGAPLGFCSIKAGELDQLFVAPAARGTGLARRLLADGEARLAAAGVTRAVLLCADGNARAAAMYEKCGWENLGPSRETVDTREGPFAFDVLRFEKTLEMRPEATQGCGPAR